MSVSILPKGTQFARVALALARCKGELTGAAGHAEAKWGVASTPAIILRAAVTAGDTADADWASALAEHRSAAADFIEALRPLTILGRISGMRRVPMQVTIPRATSGSSVGWVGQSKPIKVSKMALDTLQLDHYKLAGIVVSTKELIALSAPSADGLVRSDLLAGVAAMQDSALLDPDAAGVAGISPASITYGAQKFASSGSTVAAITSDLERLFEHLVGNSINMLSPYLITTPRIAFKLAMKRNTDGSLGFPGMGIRGGEIGGIPVIVSGNVSESDDSPQTGSIILVDAAEMLLCDTDQIMLDMSQQASVQLDDAPDDPVAASTTIVSLWQHSLAGWRVVRPINWEMRRPGAVAVLTGCDY